MLRTRNILSKFELMVFWPSNRSITIVAKWIQLQDLAELGCLRAIILFNPDARYLDPAVSSQVESLREKVYATLERYCRQHNENEVSRFAKLLLRLPALRSIGLKCVEQLFFYKLIKVWKILLKCFMLSYML